MVELVSCDFASIPSIFLMISFSDSLIFSFFSILLALDRRRKERKDLSSGAGNVFEEDLP